MLNAFPRLRYISAESSWPNAIYLRRGNALSNELASAGSFAYIFTILGDVLSAKGKNGEALYFLHKSLEIVLKQNNKISLGEVYSSLAQAYINNNQPDSAFYYAKKSFDLAKARSLDSFEYTIVRGNQLSFLYEQQKNYKEALRFHKIAKQAQDSASAQERISKLAAFAYRENQRKREKIASEKQERNRQLLYASLGGVLLFLLIAVTLYYNDRQQQKEYSLL